MSEESENEINQLLFYPRKTSPAVIVSFSSVLVLFFNVRHQNFIRRNFQQMCSPNGNLGDISLSRDLGYVTLKQLLDNFSSLLGLK